MNTILQYSLEKLEMIGDSNQINGLVRVQKFKKSQNLSPEEIITIENASQYKADYVYFRKFENRPSVPQVYLYDFTNKLVEENKLTNLHRKLYSSGQVPMFFIFTKKDIRIFNCYERPSDGKELKYKPLSIIKLASDLSQKLDETALQEFRAFSGTSLDNGTFWENSKHRNAFNFNNSAYEKLLTELKYALRDIIDQKILPKTFARKIMVISILIKYLEEREDEKGNRVFPIDFFNRFVYGAKQFTDILKKEGAYLKLLDYLAEHFNGGIFKLDKKERSFLEKNNLDRFGQFLSGEIDGVQRVLWRIYSFNDLPVELISNIYEEFLGKQPGVVYTPPFLVNFLLDESMPLSNEVTNFKILDPSCGSGVFLVGAFRRLIYRWRKKNNWVNPDLETLKRLLRENIYGVDKDKDATNLTIFSLSLALCDELEPLQIWHKLKFDDLNEKNIIQDDFFNLVLKSSLPKNFDLIIGNPPFEAKLTPAAQNIDTNKAAQRMISVFKEDGKAKKVSVKLPENQIALLFLEQSIELCKTSGLVCLIQPSGPFLYNYSSFNFRKYLLNSYFIPQIIDFTHISRILFGKSGDIPTSAIFIKKESARETSLLHITVRRTKPHKEKLYFELDTYDLHSVPRNLALNDPLIWKSNFLGGNRFHQFIKKFDHSLTIGDYLQKKGWPYGEGYEKGNQSEIEELQNLRRKHNHSSTEHQKLKSLSKKYKEAAFITGQKKLPSKAFTKKGIDYNAAHKNLDQYFKYPSKPEIFSPPHLLVKEQISTTGLIVEKVDDYLTFTRRIIGIHSPEDEKKELSEFLEYLKNDLCSLYLAFTSTEFMIGRSSSFLLKDFENIPWNPNVNEVVNKYDSILASDFWQYLLSFKRNGEKSQIANLNASEEELTEYGKIFTEVLKSVFKSLNPYQYFETDSYICYPFYFGDKPNIDFSNSENAEKYIEQLVIKNLGVSLRLTRIVRIYVENVIYLIKPKKLRFWLRSIALRDADETFSDLRQQGY